jgi:hypothetical protein
MIDYVVLTRQRVSALRSSSLKSGKRRSKLGADDVTVGSNPRRTVTRSWLEFAQPSLNSREEMWVGTVRTTQFGAVTPQTREAPCVQVEAGINLIIARRAYKLQHDHNYPLRSVSRSSRLGRSSRRGDGTIYDASQRRSAAVVPAGLKFVLSIGNPDSKRGLSRRFHGWPSAGGHTALIEDFRLESSSPSRSLSRNVRRTRAVSIWVAMSRI